MIEEIYLFNSINGIYTAPHSELLSGALRQLKKRKNIKTSLCS